MSESNESIEQTENVQELQPESEPDLVAASAEPASASHAASLLMGVKLPIRILLGRTRLSLRDVAQLASGSVVELDCSPNDPVEVIVNDKVIAHGEVVVVSGNYGVRITQIASHSETASDQGANELLNLSERLK
jgi:flagellar motor switch protein FliN/FliY